MSLGNQHMESTVCHRTIFAPTQADTSRHPHRRRRAVEDHNLGSPATPRRVIRSINLSGESSQDTTLAVDLNPIHYRAFVNTPEDCFLLVPLEGHSRSRSAALRSLRGPFGAFSALVGLLDACGHVEEWKPTLKWTKKRRIWFGVRGVL